MFAAVEWKKLMCCLFRDKAATVVLDGAAVVKMVCLMREEKSLEVGIKDARMAGFYITSEGVCEMEEVFGETDRVEGQSRASDDAVWCGGMRERD